MSERICSVEKCNAPTVARALCDKHYQRWRKQVVPSERVPRLRRNLRLAWVHSVALSYRGAKCLLWPFGRNSDGYASLSVEGECINAHRYLCILLNGAPSTDRHQAAHLCGNGRGGCVAPLHLVWATPEENQTHRKLHGTSKIIAPNRKLTAEQVREIRALLADSTLRQADIANRFSVRRSTIQAIKGQKTWAWLDANQAEATP